MFYTSKLIKFGSLYTRKMMQGANILVVYYYCHLNLKRDDSLEYATLFANVFGHSNSWSNQSAKRTKIILQVVHNTLVVF